MSNLSHYTLSIIIPQPFRLSKNGSLEPFFASYPLLTLFSSFLHRLPDYQNKANDNEQD